jgi:hypothetical protein
MPDPAKGTIQYKFRSVFILCLRAELNPVWLGCIRKEKWLRRPVILPEEAILLYLN